MRAAYAQLIIRHVAQEASKLRRFVPDSVIDAKTRTGKWSRPQDQGYPSLAADALGIQRAGGLVGMGSHGEVQGISYPWELESYACGGATAHEVKRAATLGSREIIGRAAELGRVEAGKFAALLILDRQPLADIVNTRSLRFVMKNGRLYDAETLDEVWPREKPLQAQWFWSEASPATRLAPR